MNANAERPLRTLLVAAALALACATLVTAAVQTLRPFQQAWAALERNRAILLAAGRLPANADDTAVVEAFLRLDARVLDLERRAFEPRLDAHSWDHWAALEAGDTAAARLVPVYLVHGPDGLEALVLPVHGPGMWSRIHGYLTLEADLRTVRSLVLHRMAETPGIGDRVQDPAWLATWQGKQLLAPDGRVLLDVLPADANAPAEQRIDAITGATVTSKAVGALVREAAGPDGYGPWLQQVRANPDLLGRQ